MLMGKVLAYGSVGLLAAGMMVMPVSAHGHHAQTTVPVDQVCALCTVEGCAETGYHIHDDQPYCGYEHTGGYCDGSCGVVEVCTLEGCAETGYHIHDDQTYCGYEHVSGYCDNSCASSTAGQTEGRGIGYGHHGSWGHHGRHCR